VTVTLSYRCNLPEMPIAGVPAGRSSTITWNPQQLGVESAILRKILPIVQKLDNALRSWSLRVITTVWVRLPSPESAGSDGRSGAWSRSW
jgi:hypothetical protein